MWDGCAQGAGGLEARVIELGRPFLLNLTEGRGEARFRRMVQIFKEELESNIALAGAGRIAEIVPEMVNTMLSKREVIGSVKL